MRRKEACALLSLRPYQTAAVEAVLNSWAAGHRRVLVVLPTGAGKTVVAAALTQAVAGRTLFLVHRDELVRQSVEKLRLLWPADAVGVVAAGRNEPDRAIVVASVQTLARPRRRAALDPQAFTLAIADEAHHTPSKTWRDVLQHFGFWSDPGRDKRLLGITATPTRGDQVGLHTIFETVAYRLPLQTLIREGYLADVKAWRIRTGVDVSQVPAHGGDFDAEALARVLDTPSRNRVLVEAYRQYGEGQPAVVFTATVAHARHVAEAFQAAGYAADWVSGALPLHERRARLARFHAGTTQILTNALVLTEGWDEPRVGCLILARPTKSPGLYVQMAGRGLRPYPGKAYCILIDVADTAHELCTVATLLGKPLPEAPPALRRPVGPSGDPAAAIAEPVPVSLAGAEAWDVLGRSRFVWHVTPTRMVLEAGPGQEIACERLPGADDRWTVTLRARGGPRPLADQPLPLAYAQGVAEDWVRHQGLEAYAARDAAWRRRPATPRQRALLTELGLAVPEDLTQEAASRAIRDALRQQALDDPQAPWRQEPASPRQIAWLEAHGIPVPPGLTKGGFDALVRTVRRRR